MTDADGSDAAAASSSKSEEVPASELESIQSLAEEHLDNFGEQKTLTKESPQEGLEQYVPGPLPKIHVSFDDIRQRLLSLIIQGEEEEGSRAILYSRPEGVALEELQKISLISHSLAALVSTYDDFLVRKIALQIYSEATLWVNRLFRFFDSMAYFHRDSKEGLMRVIRLVLHTRYPKYATNGYEALYTRPPIIYFNDLSWSGLERYICSELGLPISCITSLPGGTTSTSLCKLDPSALEKLFQDDVAAAKTPLLVIASAGSHLLGQTDDLVRIAEICHTHKVWLHIDGHALAGLALDTSQSIPSEFADSMTLSLGRWIGIPNLVSVTLYKGQETSHVHASGLGQSSHTMLESTLPLWVSVQALGYDNISQRIKHCLDMTSYVTNFIERHTELRVMGRKKIVQSEEGAGEEKVSEEDQQTELLGDVPCLIVFQYIQSNAPDEDQRNSTSDRNPTYYDNLNTWLVQLLARNIPMVKTDIIDVDSFGACLRICFLESAFLMNTTRKDVEHYCNFLQHQLSILNSTVKQRKILFENHSKYRKLQLVQIRDWAGMGGVRYIPEVWADRLNELTDTGKGEINNLNSELVVKLRAIDSAFSVGEADDGMLCVRFGMVDEDLNVDELITHVIDIGQEIEDSSKFLVTMAEMVKHGIEEANKELVLENQEKMMQEGLLKQVPVIGSLVSWWYPSQPESGIKGRSFDLSSGTIESTENIYKYHMQVKEGVPQTPPPSSKVLISPSSLTASQASPPHNHTS